MHCNYRITCLSPLKWLTCFDLKSSPSVHTVSSCAPIAGVFNTMGKAKGGLKKGDVVEVRALHRPRAVRHVPHVAAHRHTQQGVVLHRLECTHHVHARSHLGGKTGRWKGCSWVRVG